MHYTLRTVITSLRLTIYDVPFDNRYRMHMAVEIEAVVDDDGDRIGVDWIA